MMDPVTLGMAKAAIRKSSPTFGFAAPSDRNRYIPQFTKNASNPVFQQSQTTFPSVYWLWGMNVRGLISSPLDNYYFWYSTNHASDQGGVGLATAPTPTGPFTDRGLVFQDMVSGGIQAETPSVLYVPWLDAAKPFFMYYQKALVPNTVEQSTLLAKSADGVSWTVHGVVLTAPNNTDQMGSGEYTYFHPFIMGNKIYGYHVSGGGDYPHFSISSSMDGIKFATHPRQLGSGAEWSAITGGRIIGWNDSTVFQWQGKLWWIGIFANNSSGGAVTDNRIAIATISEDLRRLTSPPQMILPMDQPWESNNIQSLTFMADGGNLYVYYQCADKFGVAVAKGV